MKTQVFREFDAFAHSINGIDSKMLLRDPQQRSWVIDRVDLPGIEVQVGKLGSGNLASGQKCPDSCLVYLPLTPGIEYRGNGSRLKLDSFFVLYPDAEFCISTKESHDWCAITIPIPHFSDSEVSAFPRSCRVVHDQSLPTTRKSLDVVTNVMAAASTCPEFEESQAARRAASALLDLLHPVVTQNRDGAGQSTGRPRITREEIIQQSLEILDEHRCEHPSVAELALACGVSERTLRTAFLEYYGLGPSRFLQLRQLHDVRRALQQSDPDHTNVTRIMAQYGVWSCGRFAQRYLSLFGELPSATLRSIA